MCNCPAHNDKNASLSIKFLSDRVLIHCFAGCSSDDVVSSIGLAINDLFYNKLDKHVLTISKQKKSGTALFKSDFLFVFVYEHTIYKQNDNDYFMYKQCKSRLSNIANPHQIYKRINEDEVFNRAYKTFQKLSYRKKYNTNCIV